MTEQTIATLIEQTAKNTASLEAHVKSCDQRHGDINTALGKIEESIERLYHKVVTCAFRIGGSIIGGFIVLVGALLSVCGWLVIRLLGWW